VRAPARTGNEIKRSKIVIRILQINNDIKKIRNKIIFYFDNSNYKINSSYNRTNSRRM